MSTIETINLLLLLMKSMFTFLDPIVRDTMVGKELTQEQRDTIHKMYELVNLRAEQIEQKL